MVETLVLPAYAKINLALDVLGRRPDGYHEVEMVLQEITLHDLVSLRVTGKEIILHCSHPEVPGGEENLAYRAARLLKERFRVKMGVEIEIKKEIPVAAGLAGGSTDAAATLRGLNELWGLGLNLAELMALGRELGADVPYCLVGGTCLARGIGDILVPLPPVPALWVVLAKPPGGLSTGAVYQGLRFVEIQKRPDIPAMVAAIRNQSVEGIAAQLGNVLEAVSIRLRPEIARLREEMLALGALGSIMTGSGPTVFGLVREGEEAEVIARGIRRTFPGVEVIVTRILRHNNGFRRRYLGAGRGSAGSILL